MSMISGIKLLEQYRAEHPYDVIAYVSGCFDVLHTGHLEIIHYAKSVADLVVVGITSDEKIRMLKGDTRPVQDEQMRHAIISNLRSVDYAVILPTRVTSHQFVGQAAVTALQPNFLVTNDVGWQNDAALLHSLDITLLISERPAGGPSTTRLLQAYVDRLS